MKIKDEDKVSLIRFFPVEYKYRPVQVLISITLKFWNASQTSIKYSLFIIAFPAQSKQSITSD